MKKVKISGKIVATLSQDKVKFGHPEQERKYSSASQPYIFAIINRWDVEMNKSLLTSGSQSTSSAVIVVHDLGSESFLKRIAASQTGVAKFQETRLLSPIQLRRQAMKALIRSEERRKELLKQEENLESEA